MALSLACYDCCVFIFCFPPNCCLQADNKCHAGPHLGGLAAGWHRTGQRGCGTLSRGALRTALPPDPVEVPQPLGACLVLRRKTLCLSPFFWPFPAQARRLKELEHQVTRESLHQQQLDLLKTSSMEKLLEDVEQKEQHLQLLTEEAERAASLGQLQRKKLQRELRQVTPERSRRPASRQGATAGTLLFFPSFPYLSCPPRQCFSTFVTSGPTRKT